MPAFGRPVLDGERRKPFAIAGATSLNGTVLQSENCSPSVRPVNSTLVCGMLPPKLFSGANHSNGVGVAIAGASRTQARAGFSHLAK